MKVLHFVQGECRQQGVVYKASVIERTSGKTETYTGLTGRKLIDRWKEHEKDFEKPENRTSTMLSSHIWELKDRGLTEGLDFRVNGKFWTGRQHITLCQRSVFYV